MPQTPPPQDPHTSSAIIGAGIAGLTAAETLVNAGFPVAVFDKGRGPGGRMSTRREGELRFDHGAQYFTAKDPAFAARVQNWQAAGVVEPWRPVLAEINADAVKLKAGGPERFVGVPGMNEVCRHITQSLGDRVRYACPVDRIERAGDRWRLFAADRQLGEFERLIIATPPAQAAALLKDAAPHLAEQAAAAVVEPCWAAMLVFDRPLFTHPESQIDGAFVNSGPLSWIARDSAKPGRAPGERWVAHAGPEWSRANLELDREQASEQLASHFLEAIRPLAGARPAPSPTLKVAHRWRYALPSRPLKERCLFDPMLGLACCGDWCAGPRVEGACLSGEASARRVIRSASNASG